MLRLRTASAIGFGVLALNLLGPASALAQETAASSPPTPEEARTGPRPFGANLFSGSYAGQREDGLNPDYTILPGDRVMVNAWGAVTINDIFAVDTQGNLFLPTVGPVPVGGVRNADLTDVVRGAIGRVYRGQFGVYTNLLTASPVAVFVTGGVARPGRYAGIPSDSVLFFLDQAGGIDEETGSFRHVQVVRAGEPIADIDLYEFIRRGRMPAVQFSDGDAIVVGRRGPTVRVRTDAGPLQLVELIDEGTTGASVLDIVPVGPRVHAVNVDGMRGGRFVVQSVSVAEFRSMPLVDGDRATFLEDRRADAILIRLEGEFRGPAQIAVRRGMRLLDLLNHVAVDPGIAHTEAVYIRRERVRREQRRALTESLDRLERSTMLALSDTNTEAAIRSAEAEMIRQFVDRARNIEPQGLVVTASAGRQLNLLLQDDDVVVIPGRTNVVRVVGEVQVAHAVQYRPDLRVEDYVQMAGGYSSRANTGGVIIRRPNAEIVVGDNGMVIRPGDEIMVPPSIDDKFLQNGIDLAQVIYQIAVAASIVLRPL